MMALEWQELTRLTGGEKITIEKVRLAAKGIFIEGSFELPPMALLPMEDQIFIAAFVRTHGSIKEMEQIFGVSYPTIKSRLNRIGEQLNFIKIDAIPPDPDRSNIFDRLEKGEITAKEAIELLKNRKGDNHV
jgi:hypothetical protein